MKAYIAAVLGMVLAGCSDPQQPASIAAPASGQTAAPLASASDHAVAQPPAWVDEAPKSKRLTCYVDVVEGAQRTSAGWKVAAKEARLSGWAVDMDSQEQANAVLLLQGPQGNFVFNAVRSQRDDVTAAEQFKALAPVRPGVAVSMSLEGVPAGSYQVAVVAGKGGDAKRCDLGEANQLLVP